MTESASTSRGILRRIRTFLRNRSGVGAIEFALVAPMLILLYIGSAEISVAMSINKKVARAASTVADLVTQKNSVDKAFLGSMVDVANAIMSPYNESPVKLKITEIHIDGSKNATVFWSWDQDGNTPYTKGDAVALSDDLLVADTDLVRAEMSFDHSLFMPGAQSMDISTLTLSKTYYLRPRGDNQVTLCSGSCSG